MSLSQIPPEMLGYLTGEKIDNSSLQESILRVNIAIISLVIGTTLLRFWVRFRLLGAVGLDDVLMMFALLFAVLLTTSCLVSRHYGLGKHLWNLAPSLLDLPLATGQVTKSLYGCYLSYALSIAFVKFSLIATYFRIFADGLLRRTIAVVGFIVFAMLICNIFAIIFTCVPVEAAWKYEIDGKCFPIQRFFYASSGINIGTDLALCFLPIPTLWKLSMPRSQRLVLCMLFGIGSFTCVASIFRLIQLHNIQSRNVFDFSYNSVSSLNWCVIEVGAAIICASLSALRPLATRYLPRLFSFTSGTANPYYPNNTSRQNTNLTSNGKQLSTRLSTLRTPSRLRADTTDNYNSDKEDIKGEIYVQQTFDVRNEAWADPGGDEALGHSVRLGKIDAEGFDGGRAVIVERERQIFDDGSSVEVLVEQKEGKSNGRWTPSLGGRR